MAIPSLQRDAAIPPQILQAVSSFVMNVRFLTASLRRRHTLESVDITGKIMPFANSLLCLSVRLLSHKTTRRCSEAIETDRQTSYSHMETEFAYIQLLCILALPLILLKFPLSSAPVTGMREPFQTGRGGCREPPSLTAQAPCLLSGGSCNWKRINRSLLSRQFPGVSGSTSAQYGR